MLAELTEGLVAVNGFAAVAVTVTVPLVPAVTVPIFHVAVPPLCEQLPVQLLYVMPVGNVSVKTTLLADAVP
jgi:hypothetical protein